MTKLSAIITSEDWGRLRRNLFTEDGKENAAVLLCGAVDTSEGSRLLTRRILEVPADQYRIRESFQLEIAPAFFNCVIDLCISEHLQPIIVHSHRNAGEDYYSRSDDYGESRLLPVLETLIPGAICASL